MNARPTAHPSVEVLRAFILGKASVVPAEVVADHLAACADCRKVVEDLSGDSFADRVKQAHLTVSLPTPDPQAATRDSLPDAPAFLPIDVPPELAQHPDYEVRRKLGAGGMGAVYLAHNKTMDRLEVLKVVNKALLDRPGTMDRFLQEIRSAARLKHPNVVTAYSASRLGGLLVLAMEHVDGVDLGRLVREKGPLPASQACHYVVQAALGLQHAFEQGMVHRDIKPHNLIRDRKAKVKVLDFGLAKMRREEEVSKGLTSENVMMGTPDYIAPEQAVDARTADIRADIYSLGCTLYFLLTGRPPFVEDTAVKKIMAHMSAIAVPVNVLRPDIPAELAAVVAQMMAKHPDNRHQTPVEAARQLMPFVKGAVQPAAPLSHIAPPQSSPDTHPPSPSDTASSSHRMKPTSTEPPPAPPVEESVSPGWDDSEEHPPTRPTRATKQPQGDGRKFRQKVATVALIVCSAFFLLSLGWILRVVTPDGVIVLKGLPEDAEVFVDGGRITLEKIGNGEPIEIRVKPGERKLEVKKVGFKVFGRELSLSAGGREPIEIRLEPQRPDPTLNAKTNLSPSLPATKLELSKWESDKSAIRVFQGHSAKVWQVAFSPDGKHLLSGSNSHFGVPDHVKKTTLNYPGSDNSVRLWEVETGRQVNLLHGHTWEVMGLAYCPNDSNLAAACSSTEWATDYADPRVVVYNLKSGHIRNSFRLPPRPAMRGVALSDDGKRVIVCRSNSTLEAWDLASNTKQPKVTLEHTGGENFLWCVAFTSDRRRVFGGQIGGAIRLWNADTGKIRQDYLGHTRRIRSVALSPDEKRIASASDDGTVRVWDVESAKELLSLNGHETGIGAPNENERAVIRTVFSPDGGWILSGGWDGTVRLWDAKTGTELRRYIGHTECVRGVAISPNGRLAASASDDKTIRLWKLP